MDQILSIVRSYKTEISRIELSVNEEQNNLEQKRVDLKTTDISRNNISFIKDYVFQYNRIDPNKSFENFIIGSSNRLAFEASKKVSYKTSHYNPLYIYGGVEWKNSSFKFNCLKLKRKASDAYFCREIISVCKSIKSNEMVKFKDILNADVFI